MESLLALMGLLLILAFVLTSCRLAKPFSGPITSMMNHSAKETAVVGLTYVKTGKDGSKNDLFWEQVMKLDDYLPNIKGYLGHSIRRVPLGKEGWTMTVWENEEYLNAFVTGNAHQTAMAIGLGAVAKARFARVTILRSEVPISWAKAEQILALQGRDLY